MNVWNNRGKKRVNGKGDPKTPVSEGAEFGVQVDVSGPPTEQPRVTSTPKGVRAQGVFGGHAGLYNVTFITTDDTQFTDRAIAKIQTPDGDTAEVWLAPYGWTAPPPEQILAKAEEIAALARAEIDD